MKSALKVTLIYALFSTIWILASDKIVLLFAITIEDVGLYSSLKGILFVLVTGLLLYSLIRKEIQHKNDIIARLDLETRIRQELNDELHHRLKNYAQMIIALLHIESNRCPQKEALVDSVSNKLISMMAVFNVVYDHKQMANLSLKEVLEEYEKLCPGMIFLEAKALDRSFSIETLVSIVLLVDLVMEVYFAREPVVRIQLEASGSIRMSYRNGSAFHTPVDPESEKLIDWLLAAIDSTISRSDDSVLLVLDKPPLGAGQ